MGHSKLFDQSACLVEFERPHDEGEHLLVFEDGGFTYLSVPPHISDAVVKQGKLCFVDHRLHEMENWDALSDICCLRESGHVHAHVHHGDITEDILLEQCMEEAGCTLPMPWDLGSIMTPISCDDEDRESDHEHQDGCGHNRIAHGDHYDWLIPMKDGSYVLSHAHATANGVSQFIEHGRLVKVGESLGQLKRRPKQVVDLFGYEGPKKMGYEVQEMPRMTNIDVVGIVKSPSHAGVAFSPKHAVSHDDAVKLSVPRGFKGPGMTKTTLDVMGICCPSEVPLIKKILGPIAGVEEVLVNPTTKQVTVLHDTAIVADTQLVKLLNEARLDASIHQRGKRRATHKWPSPWTVCSGILLAVSFLHYAWRPLKWVALGSVALGLPPILVRTVVSIQRLVLDINALMLIAVAGAIALGDYEEAGSIAFLFTLADWLESKSTDKARDAISNVAELAPQTAVLMDGQRVGVEEVGVGTVLAVKAGELIPIDGEVVSGKSSIDESNVTGESKPVEKTTGALVWAGTMNLSGYISVKTTALSEDSAVSRMVRLVEEAQNQHSRTEQIVEKVAKYYTPLVVVSAILIAFVPFAIGTHDHRHWFYLALVLLVVACPCALVISTPVTTTCGIAQAARSGLLVRGGSYLEALAKVKVVAIDKTGTLTEGHFRVLDVQSLDSSMSVRQILYWVACVEIKSSHPLAAALVAYARLHGVEPTGDITDFEINPGLGVSAIVDGKDVQIGNTRLSASFIETEDVSLDIVREWNSQGATVVWVGLNGRKVGVLGVADAVRPESHEAVARLKKLGMKVVMLTGDSAAAAEAVRSQIGDIEVHAGLLPEDKVRLIKELKGTGVTAMVGDGINDAPALALADVGIAMGVAGSAVAMETADVALMTNDLGKLFVAIRLGQKVRLKIIQNVSLSFFTKITIIILAAVGYPTLWAAILADVGTCLVVIFNSMRLLNRKKGVVLPKFESSKHHVHKHENQNQVCSRSKFTENVNCNHEDDMGEFEPFHRIHHHTLGKTRDENQGHHLDHTKSCNHDPLVTLEHHNHHGVKVSCWPRHHHGHQHEMEHDTCDHAHDSQKTHHHHSANKRQCKSRQHHVHVAKDNDEVEAVVSEPYLSNHQHSTGWSKFRQNVKSFSGSRSRKCCTKSGTGNNCSDSSTLGSKCCTSNVPDLEGQEGNYCSKIDHRIIETTKCCPNPATNPVPQSGKLDGVGDKKCCTVQKQDENVCPRANQSTQAKKCCSKSGTNLETTEVKKCCSNSGTNLETGLGMLDLPENSNCCAIAGHERNFSSQINQNDTLKKCCRNSDSKLKFQLGQVNCQNKSTAVGEQDMDTLDRNNLNFELSKCCSNSFTMIEVSAGPQGKSDIKINLDVEGKKCCAGSDSKVQVEPGQLNSFFDGGDQNSQAKKCCARPSIKSETIPGQINFLDDRGISNAQARKCCAGPVSRMEPSPGRLNSPVRNECCTIPQQVENSCSSLQQCHNVQAKTCGSMADGRTEEISAPLDQHVKPLHQRNSHGHEDKQKHELPGRGTESLQCCVDMVETIHVSPVCCESEISELAALVSGKRGKECCLRDLSQLSTERDEHHQKQCCWSTENVPQSVVHSAYDLDKAGIPEKYIGCGTPMCQLADHSKCATEALVQSPLRDLTTFTLPVSPL